MAEFGLWMLESSLLVLMILGIRKAFTGKISYAAVYALWLVAALRFLVPVNIIPTPFGIGTMVSDVVSSWKASEAEKTQLSHCSCIDARSSEGFITSGRKKEFRRSHRASGRRKWKKHRTGEDDVSGETYNIFMEHKAERSAVGTDLYCRLDQHFRNSALLFCSL